MELYVTIVLEGEATLPSDRLAQNLKTQDWFLLLVNRHSQQCIGHLHESLLCWMSGGAMSCISFDDQDLMIVLSFLSI
jgi:hypothetical protein